MHPDLHIEEVALRASDARRLAAFYQRMLGFEIAASSDAEVVLTVGAAGRFRLLSAPGATPAPNAPGLFHTAFLFPTRAALASIVYRIIEQGYRLDGASDHFVSEAVYLSDPEGNGIEVYCDRPRDVWPRDGHGLRMGTVALNMDGLLREASIEAGSEVSRAPSIGHVHLRVSDLARARHFYIEGLGFDLMQQYGASACFASAGGYHHHIGLNTWHSAGASPAPPGAAGLAHVAFGLPDAVDLEACASRLRQAGYPAESADGELRTQDPSGNVVLVHHSPPDGR